MTDDYEKIFSMYRLRYPLAGMEIVLDPRLSTLTFESATKQNGSGQGLQPDRRSFFTLRLDRFSSYEEDLRRLRLRRLKSGERHSAWFLRHLDSVIESRESLPNQVWRDAFGELAFLLLRYGNKNPGPYLNKARALLVWLGATDERSAWRLTYNARLSFEHRYKLVKTYTPAGLNSVDVQQSMKSEVDLPQQKERELFWWSARRRYQLAREWCQAETYRNPTASQALLEETINYLHVLKDEPRQQDLSRFLSECGTDTESEVKNALFSKARRLPSAASREPSFARSFARRLGRYLPRKGRRSSNLRSSRSATLDSVAEDEVIRRAFLVWFLKRYDWLSAAKLVFKGPKRRELVRKTVWFFLLNFFAGFLYVIQLNEPAIIARFNFLPFGGGRVPLMWSMQVLLQLGSLIMLLLIAPVLFRLLMPRALFGSLLAWTTVIFLAMKDVAEFKMSRPTEWKLTSLCHATSFSDPQIFVPSLAISLGVLALDAVFVGYTVTQFTEGFRRILLRTVSTLGFLLVGSLFWGFAFALPIKVALERDSFEFDCHCVIPIVLIGSSVAVLFGLMVELIWQDQSLAEPLGEPL